MYIWVFISIWGYMCVCEVWVGSVLLYIKFLYLNISCLFLLFTLCNLLIFNVVLYCLLCYFYVICFLSMHISLYMCMCWLCIYIGVYIYAIKVWPVFNIYAEVFMLMSTIKVSLSLDLLAQYFCLTFLGILMIMLGIYNVWNVDCMSVAWNF